MVGIIILGVTITAIYAVELAKLAAQWWHKSDYVHGFLVIPFAVYLAWNRRELAHGGRSLGSYWGLLFIGASIAMRCASAYISDPVLGPLSIIPCLLGATVLCGGWTAARWLWPSMLFMIFMIPLPDFMESWGNLSLQSIATIASAYLLQTLGVPAASFGNIITLTNAELGVEEACSGLRSTVLFLAVSFGAAFLIAGIPERIAVLLAAIPVAVFANVIRIVATGLLYQYTSARLAEAVFHDLFGFLMLPLAAGMQWLVIQLLRFNLLPVEDDTPLAYSPGVSQA